jgi:hypothetical protein
MPGMLTSQSVSRVLVISWYPSTRTGHKRRAGHTR